MLTGRKAPVIYRLSSLRPFSVGTIRVLRLSSVQRQVLMRPVVLSIVMIAITLLGLAILYREHKSLISETDSA